MRAPGGARRAVFLALLGSATWSACADSEQARRVALGDPYPGLSEDERGRFLVGRSLFERQATQDEGLGPLFNAERCSGCHDDPVVGGAGFSVPVLKATRFEQGRCDLLEDSGGDNVQQRVTALLAAAGVGPEEVPATAGASVFVTAPPLFGLGLVEAVPEEALEALADPDDADGDGVSGRLPRRPDGRVARFGRKGDAATIRDFVDTALRFELGLTTPSHPAEQGRNGAPLPAGVDPAQDPEMDDRGLGLLTDYVRFLAPPEREELGAGPAADSVLRGEELFAAAGCQACHTPELRTGPTDVEVLSSRAVALFSDLLLHDLGGGTGDVCGTDAAPGEYRTTPLWGVRHRRSFLHDGSASDLEAAVAAHGGEGQRARDAFAALTPESRALLIRFLESL